MANVATYRPAESVDQAFWVQVRGARGGLKALQIELLECLIDARERLKTNHNDATALEVLPYVYSELPRNRAALALLGEGRWADRQAWLKADPEGRREMEDQILLNCSLQADDGTRVDVEY